eukprot:4121892-Amphidinium_carterae.2
MKGKNKGKQKGKGKGKTGDNNGKGNNGKTTVTCCMCGRQGHTSATCYYNPKGKNHKGQQGTGYPQQLSTA